jgi:hypothetical protein
MWSRVCAHTHTHTHTHTQTTHARTTLSVGTLRRQLLSCTRGGEVCKSVQNAALTVLVISAQKRTAMTGGARESCSVATRSSPLSPPQRNHRNSHSLRPLQPHAHRHEHSNNNSTSHRHHMYPQSLRHRRRPREACGVCSVHPVGLGRPPQTNHPHLHRLTFQRVARILPRGLTMCYVTSRWRLTRLRLLQTLRPQWREVGTTRCRTITVQLP